MQVRWMVIAGDQRNSPTILGQRHFINCMIGTSYMILINPIFWYTVRIIYEVPTKLCSEVFPILRNLAVPVSLLHSRF